MITEKLITDAWVFLRTNNNSIPDDVLDFIKESSMAALRQQNLQQCSVVGQCAHPIAEREYIGQNMLRCKICGKEFS